MLDVEFTPIHFHRCSIQVQQGLEGNCSIHILPLSFIRHRSTPTARLSRTVKADCSLQFFLKPRTTTLRFYSSSIDSQMMETQYYQYYPLSSLTVVRFLRLHPSINQFKDINIDIFEASLEKVPEYEAVSYTWDQQQPTHQIYCAGKKLSVTRNVDSILHRLRKKDAVSVLWIDSICIDQSSSLDKEAQIPIMGEIYSEARRVLVWLGNGTVDADAILENLQGAGKDSFFDDTAISKNGKAIPHGLNVTDESRTTIRFSHC